MKVKSRRGTRSLKSSPGKYKVNATRKSVQRLRHAKKDGLGKYAVAIVFLSSFFLMIYEANDRGDRSEGTVERSTASLEAESSESLAYQFETARSMKLSERMNFWSKYLEENARAHKQLKQLVAEYRIDDSAPLVPDRFDCTTFVETVMALTRSRYPDDFYSNLVAIRYKNGKPSFANRNHFPEVDWVPNNEKLGSLTDITRSLAQANGLKVQLERKKIEKRKWLEERARLGEIDSKAALDAAAQWSNSVEAQVPYLELSQLREILPQIPSGTIVNFVHRNDAQHPVLIGHQGIIIRDDNQLYVRHADQGHIRMSKLMDYLEHASSHGSEWPLRGVNLNQVK